MEEINDLALFHFGSASYLISGGAQRKIGAIFFRVHTICTFSNFCLVRIQPYPESYKEKHKVHAVVYLSLVWLAKKIQKCDPSCRFS